MLQSRSKRILIALFLASILFLFALILGFNQNNALAGLPPRPEPTATPLPSTAPEGALIELRYDGTSVGTEGVWTAVQWQDPNTEKWNTVEGWQGTVELDGTQRWWVAPADFGKGPFRWLIYDAPDGNVLQTSDTFDLPAGSTQITIVDVSIETAE